MKINLIYIVNKNTNERLNYAYCVSKRKTKSFIKELQKDKLISSIYNIYYEETNIDILKQTI